MTLIGSKLLVGFLLLIAIVRFSSKKHLAQLTPIDMVFLLVFGGVVDGSIYDEEISVMEMTVSLLIWVAIASIFEYAMYRSNRLRKWLKGTTTVLIEEGHFHVEAFRKHHLEMEQLRSALRAQGMFSIRDVRNLYIEPDGTFSIQPFARTEPPSAETLGVATEDEPLTYLLISEGSIHPLALRQMKRDERWLLDHLKARGIERASDVLYAEWSSDGEWLIIPNDSAAPRHEME